MEQSRSLLSELTTRFRLKGDQQMPCAPTSRFRLLQCHSSRHEFVLQAVGEGIGSKECRSWRNSY